MVEATWITVVILELIHARGPDWRPPGRDVFIRSKTNADVRPTRRPSGSLVIHGNCSNRCALEPAMYHSSFCPINFRW